MGDRKRNHKRSAFAQLGADFNVSPVKFNNVAAHIKPHPRTFAGRFGREAVAENFLHHIVTHSVSIV